MRTLSPTLIFAVALGSSSALAQSGALEEVIVTAQKRSENVQDIPITINVVTGDRLDDFSIRDTNDLGSAVPGLTIQPTPQNLSQVTVRGLGTGAGGESLDQSVGLFIDGIWAGRIREFQASLFDVERVEVIKGTQTSLLGKNTSLGAISIVSRRPSETRGGYLQADYETEYGSYFLTGALDLPTALADFRVAVNHVREAGYVDNTATGNEVPERDQDTLRLSALFDLGDSGSLLLSYQYDELDILGDTFSPDNDETGFIASLDPTANIGIDDTKRALTSYGSSGEAEDTQDSQRLIVEYERNVGDHVLTALGGWTTYDNERLTDSDFLSVDFLNTAFTSDYEQFSQELRIASPGDADFNYVAGLYYLSSELDYTGITDTRFPPPFLLGGFPLDGANQVLYTQDTTVWSLFGQGTWTINDRWRATLGLRYTDEEKDVVWERRRLREGGPLSFVLSDLLAPVVPPTPLNRTEDNLDGSLNIQYDVNDAVMAYASWARGSKSGGFTTEVALPVDAEYGTEQADTTEIGLKMDLAEGVGLLNLSAFHTEIENFQIITFVGTAFLTQTVPAETQGVELETRWALSPHLFVGASATYSEAEEKDNGVRLPYAPEWSASLDLHYQRPLADSGLELRATGVLNYRDEQFMQRDERSLDGALNLLDLRVAVGPVDERWEVALMARNLLNQTTSFGFDYPAFGGQNVPVGQATIGSLNRPRTLALQARYQF